MNIVTWNMQGHNYSTESKWNKGVMTLMQNEQVDYCCIQESGQIPDSVRLIYKNGMSLFQWHNYYILFYHNDTRNRSCNLAIVSRTLPKRIELLWPNEAPIGKPAIGLYNSETKHWIYNIQAMPKGAGDLNGLLQAIDTKLSNQDWIVAGDFNKDCKHLQLSLQLDSINYSIGNANNYAYIIESSTLAIHTPLSGNIQNINLSDSNPILFKIP